MSKEAEEFFRNKLIEIAKTEQKKKFLKLVDFSLQGQIMEDYLQYKTLKKINNY